jgi:hypothetical protein
MLSDAVGPTMRNPFVIVTPKKMNSDLPGHLWCHLPLRGISPKEGKAMKQISFRLNENEKLLIVWDGLPESNQREIKGLYAKLIAQVAKSEIYIEAKEEGGGDVE